jgi:hypothetical protein
LPELVRPTPDLPQRPQHGVVTTPPADTADELQVVIPDFSSDHVFEIRRWQSRGGTLPAEGDEVLVVRDEQGEPWVPAWWPAAGDAALPSASTAKGAVVHGENAGAARPGGYPSVEWIGTVEPANAIDNDTWVNPGKP